MTGGSPLRRLRPADAVTVFFIIVFTSMAVLNYESVSSSERLIINYFALLFIQLLLVTLLPEKGFLKVFHDLIFPVVAVLLIFDTMTELVPGVNPKDIDHLLIRADYILFGAYPTVWLERFINPFLTGLLQLAYTSYYFLPLILGVTVKLKGKTIEFDNGLFYILLCFYLSYVGYILFPALGPRYVMEHLQSSQLEGFLFERIDGILNSVEGIKRDAFPSGHTAVTLTVIHLAYRYERRLFYIFIPVTVLLLFATVYCRYHYVVDVLAGIGLYAITMLSGRMLLSYWTKTDMSLYNKKYKYSKT